MSKNLSKYKSVKNPCKICYQTVKPKNGLQCMGACEAWVHYQCLNYTPGKIYDIKKGLIEITCPCPDCENGKSKELRRGALYSVENVAYVNEGYRNPRMRKMRPIPLSPSGSITECTEYGSEYMHTPTQQVRGPALHTNQWTPPTVQPKSNGIDSCCSPVPPVVEVDPNSGNLMQQVMGTISELSQRLQGLMIQIQRNPGYHSPSPSALPHMHVQPIQSQDRNSAVVEWTCNDPSSNDLRNTSAASTVEEADFVVPQQDPTVVNHFGVYDKQTKKRTNAYMVNNKCCYYYKEPRVYRQ